MFRRKMVSVLLIVVLLCMPLSTHLYPLLHIAEAHSQTSTGVNMVPNPGFEEVNDGKPAQWEPYGNHSIYESSTEKVFAGTYSAKLDDPSDTYATGLRTPHMPADEGVAYEASVETYRLSGSSNLYLEFWDAAHNRIDVQIASGSSLNEWSTLEVQGVAPDQAAYATLLLYLGGGNIGTAYFDNASLMPVPVLGSVEVTADETEIEIHGRSAQLSASAYLTNGDPVDPTAWEAVTYESADPDIAIVNEGGVVTAVGVGEAALVAEVTLDGVTKSGSTTINALPYETSYNFNELPVSEKTDGLTTVNQDGYLEVQGVKVGDAITFDLNLPETGRYDLIFQGHVGPNGGLADVLLDGTSIGDYDFYSHAAGLGGSKLLLSDRLTSGEHQVRFEVSGKDENSAGHHFFLKEVGLRLNQIDVMLASVKLSLPSDATELAVGEKKALHLVGTMVGDTPADLKNAHISYATSDEEVVSVSDTGQLTVMKAGTVTITAEVTLDGVTRTDELPLTVHPARLSELQVKSDSFVLQNGEQTRISVTGTMTNGQEADLETADFDYVTGDADVAVVSDEGIVTAVSDGGVLITAQVTLEGTTISAPVWLVVQNEPLPNAKTKSTFYTAEKVANARQNIAEYDWASSKRDGAVAQAEQYLEMDDDFIWKMVTSQEVSRSLGVAIRYIQRVKGSPGPEGAEINQYGNYPWIIDPINHPWKLKSPVTGELYPTNDFKSYYESGLDEHGNFDPELAKEHGSEYLVNELYPERGETWGVDDGSGWVDEDGDVWTFVAYYNHWGVWYDGFIQNALNKLRDAYLYTGDERYAYKGLVLLDRVADVYPDMDVTGHRWEDGFDNGDPNGHSAQGKVVNDIWETGLVKSFIYAYDAFFPAMDHIDEELTGYLSKKAQQYQLENPKDTVSAIRKNIEEHILRIVYPGMKNSQIRGNMGMHQSALALAAVVLDEPGTSKEWLDFVFQSGELTVVQDPDAPYGRRYTVTGGNMNALLVEDIDRDGMPFEAAPGYNSGWVSNFLQVAEVLDGYERYPEYDLFNKVKFQKMFSAFYPLAMLGKYTPSIGDSAKTGNPGVVGTGQNILAFERFGNPVYAQLAYLKNGDSVEGIHGDIFSENPEQVSSEIEEVIETHGPLELNSTHSAGYGFAALRDGEAALPTSGQQYSFRSMKIVESTLDTRYMPERSALLFRNNQGPGHHITFAFDVDKTDEYQIDLMPFSASSYGIYNISIDDQLIGPYDFYSAPGGQLDTLTTMELTEGTHYITFEAIGKNEQSTDYYMSVMQLVLLDEQAQRLKELAKEDTRRGLWMYYGRNTGHGHKDTLNLGMHAFGLDLSPDLGYPEVTGINPKRNQWTSNTISHNTVVVDQSKQSNSYVGIPHHFDDSERVKLVDVEAPKVYPQTEQYRRTSAMIRVDEKNSYVVDFFRVKGGNDHHFSFHGAEGTVATEGLSLEAQPTGTYAGPDVPFGGNRDDSGFHFLYNVERDEEPADQFSVDWDVDDTWNVLDGEQDIHLRLTMLTDTDEVALADGDPPQNKPGNPRRLKYLIAHRSGDDLSSVFTSVMEPYKKNRFIESIEAVPVKLAGHVVSDDEVKAVKVTLENGRVDYIVSTLNKDTLYVVDDRFQFKGFFGVYSERDGQQEYGYVNDGTLLGKSDVPMVETNQGHLQGTVTDFTKDQSVNNNVTVQMDLNGMDPDELVDKWVYIETDGERNGAYPIKGVTDLGDNEYKLGIGDLTLIRRYVDANDFSAGFVYNIAEGSTFTIPLAIETVTVPTLLDTLAGQREGVNDEQSYRSLEVHLTAVGQYETRAAADKIIKHMQGFKVLLDHQKKQNLISEKAYKILASQANAVIRRWQ